MLDEKDLQAIARLMDEKISASETRMTAHMEEAISASETRMTARMEERAQESESRMMGMMESYFEPRFNLLGEQIKLIQEKMIPAEALEDMEKLEDQVDVLKAVVKRHSQEIEALKKAQ